MPRDDVELSGWPIDHTALKPYQAETAEFIGAADFKQTRRPAAGSSTLDIVTQHFSSDRYFYDLRDHEPRRFGSHFVDPLEQSTLITVILNANVTAFEVNTESGRISGTTFQNYRFESHTVQAENFIMAIETAA